MQVPARNRRRLSPWRNADGQIRDRHALRDSLKPRGATVLAQGSNGKPPLHCGPSRCSSCTHLTPLQQWGEEAEDGAIYSIVLHRMKAEPAASKGHHLQDDPSTPECPFRQYRTCKRRMIRAATLPRLMEWLVSARMEGDVGYIPSFLATYQAFTTSAQVLELLLPLGPDNEVLHVLELWLQHHPEDFWEPPNHPNLQKTLNFLKQSAPGSAAHALAEALLQAQQGKEKEYTRCDAGTDEGESPGMELSQLTRVPTGGGDCKEAAQSLLSFSMDEVAEQLTLMDAELFKAVQPFHCLGCVWSQRDKKENQHVAPSVRATVEQFNAVTSCVITSVLADLSLRIPQRAHLLEKWISIAQRCRALRNFSSLHAILSALQSNSIYRLKRTWAAVNRDSRSSFRKLSQIFSEDNNYLNCREVLLQGGDTQGSCDGCSSPQTSIASSLEWKPETKLMAPTIPYLGTFLTDLIMLDTALPDFVEGNLINFEKRRKEASILSWIRQLQESCQGYSLYPNSSFFLAFHQHHQFSEEQSYKISRMIEAPADSCPNSPKLHRTLTKRFSSLLLGSDTPAIPPGPEKPHISPLEFHGSLITENGSSTTSSLSQASPVSKNPPVSQLSTCPLLDLPPPSPLSKQRGIESRIIRVSMDSKRGNGNLYRSIVITSQDKAAAVVQRALQKHNMEEDSPYGYQLLQLLRNGQELLIPDGANVFYAMNPTSPHDFLLCHKEAIHSIPSVGAIHPGCKGRLCGSPPQKDCVTRAYTTSLPSSSGTHSPPPLATPPQRRPISYLLPPSAPSPWLLETQQADGFSHEPSLIPPLSCPLTLESPHSVLSFSLQRLQQPPPIQQSPP